MRTNWLILTTLLALFVFVAPKLAVAQPKLQTREEAQLAKEGVKKSKTETNKAPKIKVERSRGGRKVFRITTGFVIEGRIQKPNAFYVLQRSQINYDWAALKKNFLPRIVESVQKAPF